MRAISFIAVMRFSRLHFDLPYPDYATLGLAFGLLVVFLVMDMLAVCKPYSK